MLRSTTPSGRDATASARPADAGTTSGSGGPSRRQEAPVLGELVEPARPHQPTLVDRHVGATVAHVHAPVLHHVDRLDDEDRLEVDPLGRAPRMPISR